MAAKKKSSKKTAPKTTAKKAPVKKKAPAVAKALPVEALPEEHPPVQMVQASSNQRTVVSVGCRRDGCRSIQAYQFVQPGGSNRLYTCIKCGHSWGIGVGGSCQI